MENPELHDFETTDLVEKLEPNLQIVSEYNTETYNDLFVSPSVVEEYGGAGGYDEKKERIVDFLRLDYIDRDAYRDIVPQAGRSNMFVTQAANAILIRRFSGDNAVFVSVTRNGTVGATIDAVEAVIP